MTIRAMAAWLGGAGFLVLSGVAGHQFGLLDRALSMVDAGSGSGAREAASSAGGRQILYYRNPMGLPDVSPQPKKDSMGMDYIPVYADEQAGPAGTVTLSPEKIQRAGVRTALVSRQTLARPVRGYGTVAADERRQGILSVKFDGFVEELFVTETGVRVEKGAPLARVWIGSREILQKQSDYIVALRAGTDIARTANNLRLFGVPDEAIDDIRRTGSPVRSILITAKYGGTVMEKPAVVGMRFDPGETLFKLVDVSHVWVVIRVAERDLPALRLGQRAKLSLTADPNRSVTGQLTLIYPEIEMKTRTALARIEVDNADGALRIGQYADVVIETPTDEAVLAVPESAVIDSGTRRVAFVALDGGVFEPRDVTLGVRGGGMIEIRQGLEEGERIVVSGNFLIDAESNLKAALSGFGKKDADE